MALLCVVVTGCPHNDYTVELKPTASAVERTLTFYQADGGTNGVPNFIDFSTNKLADITRVYPPDAVKPDGKRFVATGAFAGSMPNDVGGAGFYTNLITSLGSTGFYLERFRGNDDVAGRTEEKFRTADKITDLVVGWALSEFGRERGWKNLRKFLEENFRHDLKNAGLYIWTGEVCALSDTNAPEEFVARFVQYLLERGYLLLSDAPALYSCSIDSIFTDGGDQTALLRLIQRLAAEKMGNPASAPLPKSFAVLADSAALKTSWSNYLAMTDLYRAKVKEWEHEKKTDPKLERPKPGEVVLKDLFGQSGNFGGGGSADHLTVKLALNRAPDHSNGKWQDGKVVWDASLEPDRALPVLCYARWSSPGEPWQTAHFGKVILDGDDLAQYCLWQNGLDAKTAGAWENFLAKLQPGDELKAKLVTFKFNGQSASGRDLLVKALATGPEKNSGSK